jgi:hypothetical protein
VFAAGPAVQIRVSARTNGAREEMRTPDCSVSTLRRSLTAVSCDEGRVTIALWSLDMMDNEKKAGCRGKVASLQYSEIDSLSCQTGLTGRLTELNEQK